MSEQASESGEELVIIRRRSAFDDVEYKGGVWKIAYADFMTAMMAFFLVMWLIHATTQETRESVASYFNPVKLAENTPDRKGLEEPKKTEANKPESSESSPTPEAPARLSPAPEPPPATGPSPETPSHLRQPRYDEASLFRDPYAILTDIAGGPAVKTRKEQRIGISLGSPDRDGTKNGEAHRDPFDPIYWQMAPQASIERGAARSGERGSLPIDEDLAALGAGEPKRPAAGKLDVAAGAGRPALPEASGSAPPVEPRGANPGAPPAKEVASSPAPAGQRTDEKTADEPVAKDGARQDAARQDVVRQDVAAKEADAKTATKEEAAGERQRDAALTGLQTAVRAALTPAAKSGPVVEVQRTEDGLMVSLTDAADFGMFAVGSAEPQPELVRVIDKIAPVLGEHAGMIVVRGHTDGRAYRSSHYDNWRLSTARAHMAYHMLVRGGIGPERIERIEGYADRRLKKADNPLAAQNRRIEILVRERPT
jgi:chemotaxis protein MotB